MEQGKRIVLGEDLRKNLIFTDNQKQHLALF